MKTLLENMKFLKTSLHESLLDMDELTADKVVEDKAIITLIQKLNKKGNTNRKYKDIYGRELKLGDIVMGTYVGMCAIGVIIAFNENGSRCAVNFSGGPIDSFKNKDGEIVCLYLYECGNLIKIPSFKIMQEIVK